MQPDQKPPTHTNQVIFYRIFALLLIGFLFCIPAGALEETNTTIPLHILAVNDFHGQLTSGQSMNGSPVGSLPVLASYLREAVSQYGRNNTIIALPGDMTGASEAESDLLLDEPTILYFNSLATGDWKKTTLNNDTNIQVIGCLGNHEFDRDTDELFRLINGGNGNTNITHLVDPYPGALWPVVTANAFDNSTGELLFEPYFIKEIDGIPVAFIGAVTIETAETTLPANVKSLLFTDEADAINKQVKILQKEGIHSFVILIHEGGTQTPYDGLTRETGDLSGRITSIIYRLDEDVDVVISAHTHQFTNQYLPNAGGKPTLVTQAYSYSKAYADIDLEIDPESKDIIEKSATIVSDYANQGLGLEPDKNAEELLDAVNIAVDPLIDEIIASTDIPITRNVEENGESLLYDIAADSMRWAMNTDMGIINEGSLRADIPAGEITTGMAYSVMPFHDQIYTIQLSGEQVKDLLNQQWTRTIKPDHLLQISGFSYSYDNSSESDKVTGILFDGKELDMDETYTIASTDFLAEGGDGYTVMEEGVISGYGNLDVDIFIDYLKSLPSPIQTRTGGRINSTNN
ncbi:bifunctional metallophosphatase/5'-nucleotidase [Methanospirillum stamsii]|uniref:Bifunctional metallophosphatase/5'-nucleotidase n=1 Tax=Methanospirillum stamsii TaxID=1277351 RepID=A0A2V2N610_9EURY|nr:bifunctional metallophosphatase/5'-nucleotidase [Methanospirillum stamsii]PWR75512.1 bifunctional metallophosphatase/5'-nucleotidase [Methanospirillum stamsii]